MNASDVELSYSCPKRREDLRGTGKRLYCDECKHHVVMLSDMTAPEACAFVAEAKARGGRVCVGYRLDEHGRVRFVSERLKQQIAGAASLIATAAVIATGVAGSLDVATRRSVAPLRPEIAATQTATPRTAPSTPAPTVGAHVQTLPAPFELGLDPDEDLPIQWSADDWAIAKDAEDALANLQRIQDARNFRSEHPGEPNPYDMHGRKYRHRPRMTIGVLRFNR